MANISDTRANYGLQCVATPSAPTAAGTVTVGVANTQARLTGSDAFFAVQALIYGASSDLVINLTTGSKSGSTAWSSGTAQVESSPVTAASGITGNGNATVTVTAAGMSGSPKAISVPLTTAAHTSATLIANAIRDALNADADYSSMFTASSSSGTVMTIRKPLATHTVGSSTVYAYAANDSTLNVAIANGTCTGITTLATSTNTTAGVASSGCFVLGDGEDFEGNALGVLSSQSAVLVKVADNLGGVTLTLDALTTDLPVQSGGTFQLIDPGCNMTHTSLTIEPANSVSLVTVVVAGCL